MKYKKVYINILTIMASIFVGWILHAIQAQLGFKPSDDMKHQATVVSLADNLVINEKKSNKTTDVQSVVQEHLPEETEVSSESIELPLTDVQIVAYEQSRIVVQSAIYRGAWEEADFLALFESSVNLTRKQRLDIQDMIGTAINQQKLVIPDPRFIPIL